MGDLDRSRHLISVHGGGSVPQLSGAGMCLRLRDRKRDVRLLLGKQPHLARHTEPCSTKSHIKAIDLNPE